MLNTHQFYAHPLTRLALRKAAQKVADRAMEVE